MAFRRLSSLFVAITLAVTLTTSVFASSSSSDKLVTYTLSVDQMDAYLSTMSATLLVTDASAGNHPVWVGSVDVSRRSDLDGDYLYFSAPIGGYTASRYRLVFTFTPTNPFYVVEELYSLSVDIVGFLGNSTATGSAASFTSYPSLTFSPNFRDDLGSDLTFSSSGSSLTFNNSVSLGNGVSHSRATRYINNFEPSSVPAGFASFSISVTKPESQGVDNYPYVYVGLKPFTFTAPDDTVDEIISSLDEIKQSIDDNTQSIIDNQDDNTQSIIDNQNKNQQAMEDFLGTPSSDDDAAQSELDSNIAASEDKMNEVQDALDSVEKPDLDQFDFDITNNDYYDPTIVSGFQSLISNSLIINMLLIVVMVIFIAYILFGKSSA